MINWVETPGHRRGVPRFRWQRVSRPVTDADAPSVAPVDFDAVPATPAANRGQDARVTGMLEGKVVVISGVRSGPGTTSAHRCANDGVDLVLAARTVDRLEAVAKQVIDSGCKALPVRADITDDDEVNDLVETTLATYGEVDVLISNAFRVSSMKSLAGTSFQHIRDAIERGCGVHAAR